jgi:hypothetical protein
VYEGKVEVDSARFAASMWLDAGRLGKPFRTSSSHGLHLGDPAIPSKGINGRAARDGRGARCGT